jgi:ABC-type transporter Mla maintaining outer membrane lipid asymmetry ATPase subunit MlaF
MAELLIEVREVVKDFRALRPLRLHHLDLHEGESIALLGFDQAMAEVLVNLITGAILPDSGSISVFGRRTAAIADAEAWVATLDQFGLISERAVMLDQLTTEQNLALPISLHIHTMPGDVRERVAAIATEVGLNRQQIEAQVATLDPLGRQRLRLGRALALAPRVLLAEHPNAPLSELDTRSFAAVFKRVVTSRQIAALVLTANREFAASISSDVFTLQPATGQLKPLSGWRRWLS